MPKSAKALNVELQYRNEIFVKSDQGQRQPEHLKLDHDQKDWLLVRFDEKQSQSRHLEMDQEYSEVDQSILSKIRTR